MAYYVDGFVLPVPRKNMAAYTRIAKRVGRIFRELGALEYRECAGDDLNVKLGLPFPRGIRSRFGETIVFSYIVYKSRAQRDRVNARIMKDPRMAALCDANNMPFDVKRMLYGGFKTIVAA